MIAARPNRAHYSETEAAEAVGVSVEKLRELVRCHVMGGEEEPANLSSAHFQPSDVLLLRLLAAQQAPSMQRD